MNGFDGFDRFDLDNNRIRNQEIETVSTIELYPLVRHGQKSLPLESHAAKPQLVTEALFIG
jgi:hypothetical protein